MRLIRFDSAGGLSFDKADLQLGVHLVNPKEAYKARFSAVSEQLSAPLFGFLPRLGGRRKVVAARKGDATLLEPLEYAYQGEPVSDAVLLAVEGAAFRAVEASMEERSGPGRSVAEKYLGMVLVIEALIVGFLVVVLVLQRAGGTS